MFSGGENLLAEGSLPEVVHGDGCRIVEVVLLDLGLDVRPQEERIELVRESGAPEDQQDAGYRHDPVTVVGADILHAGQHSMREAVDGRREPPQLVLDGHLVGVAPEEFFKPGGIGAVGHLADDALDIDVVELLEIAELRLDVVGHVQRERGVEVVHLLEGGRESGDSSLHQARERRLHLRVRFGPDLAGEDFVHQIVAGF